MSTQGSGLLPPDPDPDEERDWLDKRGELDGVDHSPSPREIENAERIATAKECANRADEAMEALDTIAFALQGLLEIAIVRADVRSYEPPF